MLLSDDKIITFQRMNRTVIILAYQQRLLGLLHCHVMSHDSCHHEFNKALNYFTVTYFKGAREGYMLQNGVVSITYC